LSALVGELRYELGKSQDTTQNLQQKLLPLLKETKAFQKEVSKEVERIKDDAELLP